MITATKKSARTLSGASTYTGTWGKAQVMHLLRRTLFGVKKSELDAFLKLDMSDAIDKLLDTPTTPPDPPVNNYNTARVTDPDIPLGQTWVNGPVNNALTGARRNSLKSWWFGQMIDQESNLLEKMTLFWHNHFATELTVYREPIHGYNHCATLRAGAMGNFKELVRKITIDPAMLIYLNGNKNTKRAPDENYARELQELFTLGKGPGSQYTEADVQAAAKVLTGWRINATTLSSYFDPNQHDTSDKTFSSFFGNTVISGRTGSDGEKELDDLLTMIFNVDEVAKFIVRKLYIWFIYYEIDEAAEQNVIEPLADIFRQNNYEMKPLLKALFSSEHFFDPLNYGCLIKSPIDYGVGFCRQYDLELPDSSNVANQYYFWNLFWQVAFLQQQDLADPPSVAGWPAYYQLPQMHEIWINTDTLPKRSQITDIMIGAGVSRDGFKVIIDAIKATDISTDPSDPDVLLNDFLDYFHTLPPSVDQREYMLSILLGGQTDPKYWTNAWNDYLADPDNVVKFNVVNLRLRSLLKYLMNLPEYQLS
ncbi:MAG: DUF1800 domain-containing protein [Flavobacteriales bacterium]|nr:DUF1800 domain-containing protein [Flavobacteriales bacterium]